MQLSVLLMAFFASLAALPGKVSNEFINPDSLMRAQLRGAAASAAGTASDSAVVARRELGDATVAVGSLVARLATSVSGAMRDGEFSSAGGLLGSIVGAPGGVSAGEAAAAAATAAEEEEEEEAEEEEEEGAHGDGGLGRTVRMPRFLRPAHGAVVVFVGGGPVGLWTALQLRLLRPLWRVAIVERHAQYVRAHVLRVSAPSFGRVVPHPEARAFVARLLGGRPAIAVRTTELERALRVLAEGVGVEVLAGEAVRALPLGAARGGAWLELTPETATAAAGTGSSLHSERLQSLLTSASVIVGCDGARSLCRRLLFGGGGLRESQSLAFMVHVRYEARGSTLRLSALAGAALFSAMGFVGEEHVGRPRGSPAVTPCTLTLVADDEALGLLLRGSGGTFALEAAPWARRLRDAVRLWLNAKADLLGEVRVAGSETVTAVRLSVYRAEAFVAYGSRVGGEADHTSATTLPLPPQQPADVAFALVGDAAFGVPYYRALNNGLLCGSDLAAALSEHGSASGNAWRCGNGGAGSPPLEGYARAVERLATQEIAAARLKAKAFSIASAGASAVHALPTGSLMHDAERIERWRHAPIAAGEAAGTWADGGSA